MGHPTREKFIKNSSTTSSAIRKLHTIAPPSPSRDVKISVKKKFLDQRRDLNYLPVVRAAD